MKQSKKLIEPDESVFRDREKEAAFWEKNFDQAWKEGKPVKVRVSRNLNQTLNIRLDSKTLDIVTERAKTAGLGPTQLIRMWVLEKINSLPPLHS